MHVVIPPHMEATWSVIEHTLLRAGAQRDDSEKPTSKQHVPCVTKTTMPMLAHVIYFTYNPNLLPSVPSLLTKYAGCEKKWLQACIDKRVCPGLLQTEDPDKEPDLLDARKRLDKLLTYLDERKAKVQKLSED